MHGLPKKISELFRKKLHRFSETTNRYHEKLWQEGVFLFFAVLFW